MPQIVIDLTDMEYKALEANFLNVEESLKTTVTNTLNANIDDFTAIVMNDVYKTQSPVPKNTDEIIAYAFDKGLVVTVADQKKAEAEAKAKSDAEIEALIGENYEATPSAADASQNVEQAA